MDFNNVATLYGQYLAAQLNREVDPDDEMYAEGKEFYFTVGLSGIRCVLHALSLSRVGAVQSILDLPCGHGRVGRHLRAAFPAAHISFCDLNTSGVRFCESRFAGQGIESKPDLTQVTFDRTFDVIWIGSLFTHLDLYTTGRWLRHLTHFLSDDGVLIATFHGLWSIEVQKRYYPMIEETRWTKILSDFEETGYGFAAYPSAPGGSLGISLSHPSRIVRLSAKIPSVRILSYTERGWSDTHDVLVLAKTDRLRAYG